MAPYESGKVYLENSKGEYKTFYLENKNSEEVYRVNEFFRSVNRVKKLIMSMYLDILFIFLFYKRKQI